MEGRGAPDVGNLGSGQGGSQFRRRSKTRDHLLIRAVARVDVGLKLSDTSEGASTFDEKAEGIEGITLTKVFFYNTNTKGRISPFESETYWDQANRKAKQPSIPDPAPAVTGKTDRTSAIADEKILLREVYVPEAANTPTGATQGANGETLPEEDTENYLRRPYIVVGLTGADKSRPDKETFFRIDYLKRTGTEADATYEYLLTAKPPLLGEHHGGGWPGIRHGRGRKERAGRQYHVQCRGMERVHNVQCTV